MAAADLLLVKEASRAATDLLNPAFIPSRASYNFSFTPFLHTNNLSTLIPDTPVCPDYVSSASCPLGRRCPNRHPTPSQNANDHGRHYYSRPNDNYVCKHWLKGLCKKGDDCDYLHEYNLRKMSECQFYNQNGYCQNGDECLYVHIKEDQKLPKCEDYEAGFCIKGPRCSKRHVSKQICPYYMAGFCPSGGECRHGVHLKSDGMKATVGERRKRVDDLDRREDENRDAGRFNKFAKGGKGGRWRDRKRRN